VSAWVSDGSIKFNCVLHSHRSYRSPLHSHSSTCASNNNNPSSCSWCVQRITSTLPSRMLTSKKSAIALETRSVDKLPGLLHICGPWQRRCVCHTALRDSCGHSTLTAPQVLALFWPFTFITLKALHRPSQYQCLCSQRMCPSSITQLKKHSPQSSQMKHPFHT